MGLTAYPQEFQKSTQSYINAGITYSGQLQTISGTTSLAAPLANSTTTSGQGTGYQKISLSASATVTWNTSSLVSKYGHIWYLEVYTPTGSTLSWGGSILWHNNLVPTQATNGRSIYEFYSPDAGTTIYGRQIMANLAGA
jgi:hypothetical protein